MSLSHINDLLKENKRLKLKIKLLERQLHHFCPDCRDKVSFESCLRCQRDSLVNKMSDLEQVKTK